jgi:hypothetical protein
MLDFILTKKKTVSNRGYFGYYSLEHWWDTKFSESEKERFRTAYENSPMSIPFDCLFQGAERPVLEDGNKKKTALGFLIEVLHNIAHTKGYEDISGKIIDKCMKLVDKRADDAYLYTYYLSQFKFYNQHQQQNAMNEMPIINRLCTKMLFS